MTPIKRNLELIVKDLVYLRNCGRRRWEVNEKMFLSNLSMRVKLPPQNYHGAEVSRFSP